MHAPQVGPSTRSWSCREKPWDAAPSKAPMFRRARAGGRRHQHDGGSPCRQCAPCVRRVPPCRCRDGGGQRRPALPRPSRVPYRSILGLADLGLADVWSNGSPTTGMKPSTTGRRRPRKPACDCATGDLDVLIIESADLDPNTRDWRGIGMTVDLADGAPEATLAPLVERVPNRTSPTAPGWNPLSANTFGDGRHIVSHRRSG